MATIEWTDSAIDDLWKIRDFIARDSKLYAEKMIARILSSVRSLEALPERGWEVAEFPGSGVREIVVQSYRVLYDYADGVREVLAVIHGSRDLASVLDPEDWSKRN
jgi:addiction module RelE/StbE family toxin